MAFVMSPTPDTSIASHAPATTATPDPMSDLDLDLNAISWIVADRGVAAVDPRHIDSLVGHARAAGASPTLIEILEGSSEPAVARVRAFGRIAGLVLSRRDRTHATAPGLVGAVVPQPR